MKKKNASEHIELRAMRDDELEQWFGDNLMTLKILKQEKPELYKELKDGFQQDLNYLHSINRISEDLLEYVKSDKNFDF